MNQKYALLLQKITMWQEQYRKKKMKGKTEKELKAKGWWQDSVGDWYCDRMERAQNKYFDKESKELLWEIITKSKIKKMEKIGG